MHLKSLTLKGFKSFASATHLRFEPGITCVVGPNGSGKSNVVDAIAWVLGEQGAKALRGGKMDDVIFAGTAGRAALGRAEVTLTIDNSDAALPIEYTEVSITRRLFRSGESEYEINGQSCRLLDIQELLSDSGIGREMHVIVGQGQLDSVLQARPEERRGFIEEAAGVLKHRKRKEKALRKLDAMQANLARIQDLTAELRRQLKPLGRQAEVARRAATIQAELREARLRLLADDVVTLRATLDKELADDAAIRQRRGEVEQAAASTGDRVAALERELAVTAPQLAAAQEAWFRLSALQERLRGTGQLAAERARHLAAPLEEAGSGRDPEQLEREAAEVELAEAELEAVLTSNQERLDDAVELRRDVESRLTAAERALVAAAKAAADRREGLARLTGQVESVRSRLARADEELERLAASIADARERAAAATGEFTQLQQQVGALDAGEVDLDARHEEAERELAATTERLEQLVAAEHEAERDHSVWSARHEALAHGLTRRDGTGAVLASGAAIPGLLGSVAALLTVDAGYETAVAAALGAVTDAVAVGAVADAVAALRLLKESDGGRAGLLVVGAADGAGRTEAAVARPQVARPQVALPPGARWIDEVVTSVDPLRRALHQPLAAVAVVEDLAAAAALVTDHPDVRAVTRDGDLLGAGWASGGSASAPTLLEVQAEAEEARQQRDRAEHRRASLAEQIAAERARREEQAARVARTLEALHDSDARMNAVAEHLAQLGSAARAATAEAERAERGRAQAEQARDRDRMALAELEERLEHASDEPIDEEPSAQLRDELGERARQARQSELEARLAVRTAEERVRALQGRAGSLRRAAEEERQSRQRRAAVRRRREEGARIAAAVAEAATVALHHVADSSRRAAAERDAVQQGRQQQENELRQLRATARDLGAELERLTDAVHKDEVARAELRLRLEQLENRVVEEFALEVATLVAEYGPQLPVGPSAAEQAEYEQALERGEEVTPPPPVPYHRPTQEKRAARAERELALLGKVNPLALEEFAALEERYKFLGEQLEDLKSTRRDLLTVVRDVDERIHEVFRSAFEDTAREFEVVFATLFPGGEGRLILTDPEDLLTTGVEVEARPPGKKVKRLSLLSGGERSLTAVALLVAIFRARPSPFYVMDEVEAALDDVNLGRLLELVQLLRESSQLIIITHQKRTMEIGDALYGVSMRGDGITQVISQRLREREVEPA